MSGIKGRVGSWDLHWTSVPRGPIGAAYLELRGGEKVEVHWRKDRDGIWIQLPDGVYGFDISAEPNEEGSMDYRISRRGSPDQWDGLCFLRAGEEHLAQVASGKRKGHRLRAQMPGKILKILVEPDMDAEKDQPLMVMEAMKMENEIKAPHSGRIAQIKVSVGQVVESGAELLVLE